MSRGVALGIGVALVVAAVVAIVISQSGDDDSSSEKTNTTATTTQANGEPAPVRIKVANGKPVGGVRKITVKRGELVRVTVSSSDTTEEVHNHVTDQGKEMSPGHPAVFAFRPKAPGISEIELEDSSTQLVSLTVK